MKKYVRTKDGIIIKRKEDNLLDILEIGDYVNGYLIISRDSDGKLRYIANNGCLGYVENLPIMSIVTREQFEKVSFRVER